MFTYDNYRNGLLYSTHPQLQMSNHAARRGLFLSGHLSCFPSIQALTHLSWHGVKQSLPLQNPLTSHCCIQSLVQQPLHPVKEPNICCFVLLWQCSPLHPSLQTQRLPPLFLIHLPFRLHDSWSSNEQPTWEQSSPNQLSLHLHTPPRSLSLASGLCVQIPLPLQSFKHARSPQATPVQP